MAWNRTIKPEEAEGELKFESKKAMERRGSLHVLITLQSLNLQTLSNIS
jgi:hypothetical protein